MTTKQEPAQAKAPEAQSSAPPQQKVPSAEDFRRLESQRDQAEARAKKTAGELEVLRGELDELKLTAELAEKYGGDENAIAAHKSLGEKERELAARERRLQREAADLDGRRLEVAAGLFHTQNMVPLSVFEGIKTLEGIEAAAYRWLYEQGKPAPTQEKAPPPEQKQDYETGSPTRKGKSIGDMTPEEAEKERIAFITSHMKTLGRR